MRREPQRQFLADIKAAGAFAGVAVGLGDALAILEGSRFCVGG